MSTSKMTFVGFVVIFAIYFLFVIHRTSKSSTQHSNGQETPLIRTFGAKNVLLKKCANRHETNSHSLQGQTIEECSSRLKPLSPGDFEPQQVALTFHGVESEMGVTWVTLDDEIENLHHVEFCRSSNDGSSDDAGSCRQNKLKTVASTCQIFRPFADCRFMVLHAVNLTHLHPGKNYNYQIFNSKSQSKRFNFKSFPSSSNLKKTKSQDKGEWTQRFLVFADVGLKERGGIATGAMTIEVEKGRYDMALSMGDYAYDLVDTIGKLKGTDLFKMEFEGITSRIPLMMSPGNHERFPDPGGAFYQYKWRFTMPGQWPNQTTEERKMYYSFNLGKVHIIYLNTELFYHGYQVRKSFQSLEGNRQIEWLENDLKDANKIRQQHPWFLLFGHRPPYCNSNDEYSQYWACERPSSAQFNPTRFAIEKLIKKYKVDLCFWGDIHSYERTYPVFDARLMNGSGSNVQFHEYTNPKAPAHIINGVAGNNEGTDGFWIEGGKNTPKHFQLGKWAAFRSRDYGFGRLTIFNSSNLHYDQVSVKECPMVDQMTMDDPCRNTQREKPSNKNEKQNTKVIDHVWIVKH